MTPRPTVLVSGAGIAGATVAFWLRHHGFAPLLVEIAPAPRPGGQAVDVRGPALTVAERMGVAGALRAARTDMRGMSLVDADGAELMRSTTSTLTGGPTDGPDVEILRDDLTDILLGAAEPEILFGRRVAALAEDDDGVRVGLSDGSERTVDLVVGADGLHSGVRGLAFPGPGAVVLDHLGAHLAVFTMPNRFGLDRWQVFSRIDDRMSGLYTARDNREVRVNLGFTAPGTTYDHRDLAAQRALVAQAFAGDGWWVPEMLEGMAAARDFYLSPMTRVVMPRWSAGRVALVGDAGYCATPLSGQGTSLAMVGAYVLAGELARAGGDHRRAFGAYERRLRTFVEANQALAVSNAERTQELVAVTAGDARRATDGFDEHWVASAATEIELEDY